MNKTNKGEILFLIKPILFLIIIAILLVVLILVGINQVKSVIAKTNESKEIEITLNQKITILQKVTEVISGDTTFLDLTIPGKSAVLYALSQIKNEAYKNNLLVSNIKTSAPVSIKSEMFKNSISFDVEGDETSVYNFLKSFSKLIPLMNIEKVKINSSGSNTSAVISSSVYSAELPKTIPSVSSIAVDLTDAEVNLLNELTSYTLPVFIESKALETQPKEDPFN